MRTRRTTEGGDMSKDPVCGMNVDEKRATERAEHEGRKYVFCSASCRERFERSPESYVGASKDAGPRN